MSDIETKQLKDLTGSAFYPKTNIDSVDGLGQKLSDNDEYNKQQDEKIKAGVEVYVLPDSIMYQCGISMSGGEGKITKEEYESLYDAIESNKIIITSHNAISGAGGVVTQVGLNSHILLRGFFYNSILEILIDDSDYSISVSEYEYAKTEDVAGYILSIETKFGNINDRLQELENKEDNDTIYDDSELRGRIESLESNTGYDDNELRGRIETLEQKTDYDDTDLKNRIESLEQKEDNDTIYDDNELRGRIESLESTISSLLSSDEFRNHVMEILKEQNVVVYEESEE